MDEIRVASWNELNEVLYAESWHAGLRRFRSPFVFRGLSKDAYNLDTGLTRLGGPFDQLGDTDFVVFFEPPSLDDRIVNQFALFSLMSDPRARLDRWLPCHPEVYRRIVIPAKLKWEVRDKLDQANITERVLFPGLDGSVAGSVATTRRTSPQTVRTVRPGSSTWTAAPAAVSPLRQAQATPTGSRTEPAPRQRRNHRRETAGSCTTATEVRATQRLQPTSTIRTAAR